MCPIFRYLSALRDAWLRGVQPGHDDDTELTRAEEEREVLDPWTADNRCVYCGGTRDYIDLTGGCVGPLCPNKFRVPQTSPSGHPPRPGAGPVVVAGSPTSSDGDHPHSLHTAQARPDSHYVSGGVGSALEVTGGGQPTCPYCDAEVCCSVAAEDIAFYRWEHGLI